MSNTSIVSFIGTLVIIVALQWFALEALAEELTKSELEASLNLIAVGRKDVSKVRIQKILLAINTKPKLKQLVTNEILVRKLYTLKFGDTCDFKQHSPLESPPENPDEYIKWQTELISNKPNLCDPIKNLRCSSVNKCRCGLNLEQVFTPDGGFGGCAIHVSSVCGEFWPKFFFYDPLSLWDDKKMSAMPIQSVNLPPCVALANDAQGGPAPCFKPDYMAKSYCMYSNEDEPSVPKLQQLSDQITSLSKISAGESCDSGTTTTLFRLTAAEMEDYRESITKLTTFKDSGKNICNLKQVLYCPDNAKCNCLEPTVLNPDTKQCEIPLWQKCVRGAEVLDATLFFHDKQIASIAHHSLTEAVKTIQCVKNSICTSVSTEVGYSVCACPPEKVGLNCNEPLSNLLRNVQPTAYLNDADNFEERVSIFSALNKNMLEFEKISKLQLTSHCDELAESNSKKVFTFITKISGADPSSGPELDKSSYEEISGLAGESAAKGIQVCDGNVGLICASGICTKELRTRARDDEERSALLNRIALMMEKVKSLAKLQIGEPCKNNLTGNDPSAEGVLTHLEFLVSINESLCTNNLSLVCLDGKCNCGHNRVFQNSRCVHTDIFDTDSASLNYFSNLVRIFATIWLTHTALKYRM